MADESQYASAVLPKLHLFSQPLVAIFTKIAIHCLATCPRKLLGSDPLYPGVVQQ